MQISTGEATPESRWPTMLARVLAYWPLAWLLAIDTAAAAESGFLDPITLLKLGIDLGIIAFGVGIAIVCLRAIKRARVREAAAAAEAERLSLSENTLETVLAAEPQALLTLGENAVPELLVSNLPGSFGVPRDASRLLAFEQWLEGPSATDLESRHEGARRTWRALQSHASHQAWPIRRGRRPDRRTYIGDLKVRDIAGQRLELAELSARHNELEEQVEALRSLLAEAKENQRDHAAAQAQLETHFRSFDRLATAFAVFDSTQRLAHYNQAYMSISGNLIQRGSIRARVTERFSIDFARPVGSKNTQSTAYGKRSGYRPMERASKSKTAGICRTDECFM